MEWIFPFIGAKTGKSAKKLLSFPAPAQPVFYSVRYRMYIQYAYSIDGQVRLVPLQLDNFRFFLCQQTDKQQIPFARWQSLTAEGKSPWFPVSV